MSNVEKFEELLRTDEVLQAKVKELAGSYEGDREDEKAFFEAVFAPLAEEAGLPFTFEDGIEFAEAGKELDDTELDSVAGGKAVCWVIGGSTEPEVSGCSSSDESTGGNACAYVGVTWGNS